MNSANRELVREDIVFIGEYIEALNILVDESELSNEAKDLLIKMKRRLKDIELRVEA